MITVPVLGPTSWEGQSLRLTSMTRACLITVWLLAISGCGVASIGQSTAHPAVRIVSPTSFAQISTSTVTVRVAISHFTLAAGGLEQPGSGQVWIYANGHVASHLGSSTTTLGLAPGTYFLKAVLVTNGTAVASSASVVVTVSGSVSLPPTSTSGAMPTLPTISCATKPVPSTGLKSGTITLFCQGLPTGDSNIGGLVAGPGGNLWFTEQSGAGSDAIGRITPTGTITLFSRGLSQNAALGNIVVGPDGDLWFTEQAFPEGAGGADAIGRITPSGTITLFSRGLSQNAPLGNIVVGPDGNLWFTEQPTSGGAEGVNTIGRITPSGTITLFSRGLSQNAALGNIVVGSDGNLWFPEQPASGAAGEVNAIGRITPSGTITLFTKGLSQGGLVSSLVAGPDGNLWFTEQPHQSGVSAIGRITPSGMITLFSKGLPVGNIMAGPDGNLWFTVGEPTSYAIGRITPSGTVTLFSRGLPNGAGITAPGTGPALVTGPDGNLWFAWGIGDGIGGIGRITPAGTITSFPEEAFVASAIAAGPDGNLWFVAEGEALANVPLIGRIIP